MTDHFTRAEEILSNYHQAEEAGRALDKGLAEAGAGAEERTKVAEMLIKGTTLMLMEAQVHATLAVAQRG